MDFQFTKQCSVNEGQTLYGIIEHSCHTYGGVYPITVEVIDYNNEEVVFKIGQPCGYVSCSFSNMSKYVFETEDEARKNLSTFDMGEGISVYNDDQL